MRWTTTLGGVVAICLIGFIAGFAMNTADTASETVPQSQGRSDPIIESFERELNHEPGPVAQVHRESIGDDVLYRTINARHWTLEAQTNTATSNKSNLRSNEDESTSN